MRAATSSSGGDARFAPRVRNDDPGPARDVACLIGVTSRFLRSEEVEMIPVDERLAHPSGERCGATNTSDIIGASVVILARERKDAIVTSDPSDLRRLDPATPIIAI